MSRVRAFSVRSPKICHMADAFYILDTYSGLRGRSLSPPPDRPLPIHSPGPMDQCGLAVGSEQIDRIGEEDGGLTV